MKGTPCHLTFPEKSGWFAREELKSKGHGLQCSPFCGVCGVFQKAAGYDGRLPQQIQGA